MNKITDIDVHKWIDANTFAGVIHYIDTKDKTQRRSHGAFHKVDGDIESFFNAQRLSQDAEQLRRESLTIYRRTQHVLETLEDLRRAFVTLEEHRSKVAANMIQSDSLNAKFRALNTTVDANFLTSLKSIFTNLESISEQTISQLQHERTSKILE